MKILIIEPNKEPYVLECENIDSTLYGLIYYPYSKIELEKDIHLIYSKEGQDISKINRKINNKSIYGTFAVIKSKNNKAVSLTDKEIKELKDYFN